jgi:hypothetical protein
LEKNRAKGNFPRTTTTEQTIMSQDQDNRRVEIDPMDVALGVQIAKNPIAYILTMLTFGVFKGIWFVITLPFQAAKEAAEHKRQQEAKVAQDEAAAKAQAEHRSRVTAAIVAGIKSAAKDPLQTTIPHAATAPPLPATRAHAVAPAPDPEKERQTKLYEKDLLEIRKSMTLGKGKVDPAVKRVNTAETQILEDTMVKAKTLIGLEELAYIVVQFPETQEILQRWELNPQQIMEKLAEISLANNDHPALGQTELTQEVKNIFSVSTALSYRKSGPPEELAIVGPKHLLYALLFFEKTGRIGEAMGIPSHIHPMTYVKS